MQDKVVISVAAGFFLVIFFVLIGLQTQEQTPYGISKLQVPTSENGVLHFFTIGDFGTTEYKYEEKTSIQAVADLMVSVREKNENPLQLVMTLGDNRYYDGPQGIFDHLIYEMMTKTYAGTTDVPWYLALGNHDCREGLETSIDLTQIYQAWNMPSAYYNITLPIDDANNASFVFLNSCALFCVHWEPGFDHKCTSWDFEVTKEVWQEHYDWIEKTLAEQQYDNSIKWRFVVLHHPIFNVGTQHGDNESLKQYLFPLMSKYNIDVVFAGHEHTQQFYRSIPFANLTTQNQDLEDNCVSSYYPNGKELVTKKGEHVHEVVMGASGKDLHPVCPEKETSMAKLDYGLVQYGFCDIEVTADRMNILYYSVANDGEVAFNVTILN